jgi:hypothetical protein
MDVLGLRTRPMNRKQKLSVKPNSVEGRRILILDSEVQWARAFAKHVTRLSQVDLHFEVVSELEELIPTLVALRPNVLIINSSCLQMFRHFTHHVCSVLDGLPEAEKILVISLEHHCELSPWQGRQITSDRFRLDSELLSYIGEETSQWPADEQCSRATEENALISRYREVALP